MDVRGYAVPKDGQTPSMDSSYWLLASARPHDETPEFAAFTPAKPEPRQHHPMPRILPERQQNFNPPPAGPRPVEIAPWMHELLAFRKPPVHKEIPETLANVDPIKLKQTQDMLGYTLLKLVNLIIINGDIKSKMSLSQQAPMNELKTLMTTATVLIQEVLEPLPPYLACISAQQLEAVMTKEGAVLTAPNEDLSLPSSYSLPRSVVPLPVLLSPSCMPSYAPTSFCSAMSAPLPSQMGSRCDLPFANEMSMSQQPSLPYYQSVFGNSYQGGSFPQPFGVSNFTRRARNNGNDIELFASPHATLKKLPAVGDRPLTPPAHGWHAKYSSGVTGVVWDRVHQAWVVSWTLAGKRTFRHFTCKSYGGFDKARDAAIEFRLARNRDIAAYNKRHKDRR